MSPFDLKDREEMSLTFDLADGRRAFVNWCNGPPYLSVSYSPPPERCEKEEDRSGTEQLRPPG